MCGEFGGGNYDQEDSGGVLLEIRTVKARKAYRCDACGGDIGAGSYYAVIPYIEDGRADQDRAHLQCRDVMKQIRCFGAYVVIEEFHNDEERGELALAHHVAVAEWASGLPYKREDVDA